jgi:hypothetical protein
MFSLFRFFATGKDISEIKDKNTIDKLYKKYRLKVMLAITVGYGLAYPLRLALNVDIYRNDGFGGPYSVEKTVKIEMRKSN